MESSGLENMALSKEIEEKVCSLPFLSNPNPQINGSQAEPLRSGRGITRRSKRIAKSTSVSIPSIASSSSSSSQKRVARVAIKRRSPSVFRGGRGENNLESLALPLGMSFAAVIAQVLGRKDAVGEKISADRLSMICTSAVKESLANVFGDKVDYFMRNFEKSFDSTLKTLQLINEAFLNKQGDFSCTSDSNIRDSPSGIEEIQDNIQYNPSHQLIPHGQTNQQLACVSQSTSVHNQSILSTFDKSVLEQARSNDLKTLEISLIMRRLQLKESQLALSSAANFLERFKLSMGISKASFKEEKFKNQLQDMRHAELLGHCIDCLVAGLLLMLASLTYGAYTYSYKRITDATASCTSSPKGSKSWWLPNPVASFSSGWQLVRCHVIALSRMLFGASMILALAYSLLQRSASCRQTMPVTFIILLLGVACGFAGKLCVDSLGGSGYWWLLYWESLCLLHFVANVFTSVLFNILHGTVTVTKQVEEKIWFPYWIRRVAFYSVVLLFLPVLCGLMPFASFREWKDHFFTLVADKLLEPNVGAWS
ncbi:CPR5 protein [Tasmannia lanceolata]|uniref:CPR5 protein n=1 Tax=Tasmannia lanceolata TaxID=3420 RepID=UPI004064ACAD